ncbi:MAG: TIGR04086 family membrane protein [Clostridia bacterium]|nr:TIGR04086 family membrane protein [Clostridia bacterium]
MNHSEQEGVTSVSNRIIRAAVTGWLVLFVGVLLSALVFHIFYIPEVAISWVGGAITYIAALLSGYRAAKGAKRKGFMKGLWAGVLFVAGYIVLTLVFQARVRIFSSLILLAVAMVGGMVGINQKTKPNNIRKGISRL